MDAPLLSVDRALHAQPRATLALRSQGIRLFPNVESPKEYSQADPYDDDRPDYRPVCRLPQSHTEEYEPQDQPSKDRSPVLWDEETERNRNEDYDSDSSEGCCPRLPRA